MILGSLFLSLFLFSASSSADPEAGEFVSSINACLEVLDKSQFSSQPFESRGWKRDLKPQWYKEDIQGPFFSMENKDTVVIPVQVFKNTAFCSILKPISKSNNFDEIANKIASNFRATKLTEADVGSIAADGGNHFYDLHHHGFAITKRKYRKKDTIQIIVGPKGKK